MNPLVEHCESDSYVSTTVPWYNKSEFLQVYQALFSENVFDMKWAANRINVWEGRCHPTLDSGIDAMAGLIRAILQDKLFANKSSLCDTPDLRLLYATALIRFTNVVSHVRHAPTTKMSIQNAAAKMKIPGWIVDLRNKAAHVRLPCIDTLRQGAKFALEYLRTNYWSKVILSSSDYIISQDPVRDKVTKVILEYLEYQYERLDNKDSRGGLQKVDAKMSKILAKMRKFIRTKLSVFLEILVSPGMFLPSSENLLKLLQGSDQTSFIDSKSIDLPLALEQFWIPLIRTIVQENALQEFAEQLLKTPKENLHQKVAACWMLKFIDCERDSSVLQKIPSKYRPSFNFFRLLGCCLCNCCEYSTGLLPIIFSNLYPRLSEDELNYIVVAVSIYIGAIATQDEKEKMKDVNPGMSEVYTTEQLKELLKNKQREEKGSMWHQPPDDIDLANKPIGYVFGDQEFTNNVTPAANEEVEPEAVPVKIEPKLEEEKRPQIITEEAILGDADHVKPFEYNPNNIALYCMMKH